MNKFPLKFWMELIVLSRYLMDKKEKIESKIIKYISLWKWLLQ